MGDWHLIMHLDSGGICDTYGLMYWSSFYFLVYPLTPGEGELERCKVVSFVPEKGLGGR